jgi:hypothetical protein
MNAEGRRACPSCGNEFFGTMDFCPVCMLRKGLAGGVESGESSFEETVEPAPEQTTERFEHYELVKGEAGRPVELGRGAMGVTYKAFDVDLHRPVTLKVISERYLGDESARLRFLREARAAASVRHPNVASVFHLGRTGQNYFYAMEFVEGFRGSPAEVMYQHQHAPLPRNLLEPAPQPVVVLLDVLLEKDPGRRFQNPAELLKAIPTITSAIDTRRKITRQNLQKAPSPVSRAGNRKTPARLAPKKISIARLP